MGEVDTKFKPGHKKVGGRQKRDTELHRLSALTKTEAIAALSGALKMTLPQIEALLESEHGDMLHLCAAKIVYMAYENADQAKLDFLFNRLIGKPKEEVEMVHRIEPRVIEAPMLNKSVTIEFQDNPEKETPDAIPE